MMVEIDVDAGLQDDGVVVTVGDSDIAFTLAALAEGAVHAHMRHDGTLDDPDDLKAVLDALTASVQVIQAALQRHHAVVSLRSSDYL